MCVYDTPKQMKQIVLTSLQVSVMVIIQIKILRSLFD